MLLYYGNVNMGYQIVTYKDITDVIEKVICCFSDWWIYFIFDRGDGNCPLFEPSKNHSTAYKPKRSYAFLFLKVFMILKYRQREIQNLRR